VGKKILIGVSILLGVLIIGIGGLVTYVNLALPDAGLAPDLKVELTQERIDRGSYLANSVTVCMDCHSQRDWTKFSGPLVTGSNGSGGEKFSAEMGFPGDFYSPNLTPSHLGDWTDGEIYRAITAGVNKDGKPLFPLMPWPNYGKMDTEDVYAIIAYIRSLSPIENTPPPSEPSFPFSLILRTLPHAGTPEIRPDTSNSVEYGKYLVSAAACADCHTPVNERAEPLPGMHLAGGREFPMMKATVRSSNLTADLETGIGKWSKEQFVQRFKAYADSNYHPNTVAEGDFNTVMPWTMYGSMTVSDLSAIYSYLQTVQPVSHKVERFTASK